jgi:DNA repair ATPase RecN
MGDWKKIQCYREKFKNNEISQSEFTRVLKDELQKTSKGNYFVDEKDLLLKKINRIENLLAKLEAKNKEIALNNAALEKLILDKFSI